MSQNPKIGSKKSSKNGKPSGSKTGKDIGLAIEPPKRECQDTKCPWHGRLPVRGKVLKGEVTSSKTSKTAVVKREFFQFVPKYERYKRKHSKIRAYNPECLEAKEGDKVTLAECRPLSKSKSFVIVEKW